MPLTVREPPHIIPEYSLTGDLLSNLTCGLQYRLYKRGQLPASSPVERWFGEFIHGATEEAFARWEAGKMPAFPWAWQPTLREIETAIQLHLTAKGLMPHPRLYCRHDAPGSPGLCTDKAHPHKMVASQRVEAMVNSWGPHLFPLISEAEVKLQGLRDMPPPAKGAPRADHYSVTGVVDVVSSVTLGRTVAGNRIVEALQANPIVKELIAKAPGGEFEVIIDYKGMRRPNQIPRTTWTHHEWQLLTYAWLRSLQPKAKPIVAGILFYVNELAPSGTDIDLLQQEVRDGTTDLAPKGVELRALQSWRPGMPWPLDETTRIARSIRIVPAHPRTIQNALDEFDREVTGIEACIKNEADGGSVLHSWPAIVDPSNCVVCDFNTFCPKSTYRDAPKVP